MVTHRLVVARYDEDMGWLSKINRKKWHINVVTKGQQVPNEGREAASFLWAMEQFYDDDGFTCFVQGNPFDHYPSLVKVLNEGVLPLQVTMLSRDFASTDEHGGPHDSGLPVKEWFEDYCGKWPGDIQFGPGGQFVTPACWIRSRTKQELRELYSRVCESSTGAWTMERLWYPYLVW